MRDGRYSSAAHAPKDRCEVTQPRTSLLYVGALWRRLGMAQCASMAIVMNRACRSEVVQRICQ
jgi:hypothetical protein